MLQTTTTGEVPDKNVRPTIFSAFPELRHSSPTVPSRHAHKHRHLLEAFSGMDEPTAHGTCRWRSLFFAKSIALVLFMWPLKVLTWPGLT